MFFLGRDGGEEVRLGFLAVLASTLLSFGSRVTSPRRTAKTVREIQDAKDAGAGSRLVMIGHADRVSVFTSAIS